MVQNLRAPNTQEVKTGEGAALTSHAGGGGQPSGLDKLSAEEFLRQVNLLDQEYGELIGLLEQPYAQSHVAVHDYWTKARNGRQGDASAAGTVASSGLAPGAADARKSPVSINWLFLPNAALEQDRVAQIQAQRAMLLAAIEARLHGDGTLANARDPFGDGPFTRRDVSGGYELESKLVVSGKPVTLFIGD